MPGTEPRLAELWAAAKTRLDTATMQSIIGAAGRVQLSWDTLASLAPATEPWGRVVVIPVSGGGGVIESGVVRRVHFVVRCDRNEYRAPNYDPLVSLEAAQSEVRTRLDDWVPTASSKYALVVRVYRKRPAQALPLWDAGERFWFTASTYAVEVLAY